jgi:hypothetical protein
MPLTILRTNGVNNPNQYVLDVCAGSNVTLAVGVAGQVTIAASGGVTPSGANNLVFATPDGSSGVASLRALVDADLPPIDGGTY